MKKIILVFITIFSALNSQAQSFSHELGIGGIMYTDVTHLGAFYSPRFNISKLGENATISLGSNLNVGFPFQSKELYNNSLMNIQVPIIAQYNFGNKSNPENKKGFGYFIGAGGAINYTIRKSLSGSMYGPQGTAGIKFKLSKFNLGLRGSYMFDLSPDKLNVVTINLFTTF